jgi:hypothetical protein
MNIRMIARTALMASALCGLLAAEAPQATTLSPSTASPGSELNVKGLFLGKDKVQEVYLTDHKFDLRVKVLEQTDTSIKFRIPPFAKAGRMQLMLLVPGKIPKLLEQPVYVTVEDNKTELSSLQ